ncbi:MAG TPA: sulfatase-like hydrolase/transferase, partial [Candidatus Avacidaminococcus intestinavium]|nr:sulfatase-like hydrolase/transferase [Candidatus Avacidaminococcus intestinavium]
MALAFLVFSIILLIIYFGFTNILTKRWAFWRYTFFSLVLLVLATSFLTDIWTGIILYGLILFFSASTFPFLFKKNKGKQPVYGRFVLAETGFATGFCAFMLSLQTLLLWFLPNELVITISSLIQFIYLLMPLSYIIYYLIDHDLLNSDYFVAIYQSTWNGVKNFAKTAFSLKGYMAIIMSIVIIIGGLYCLNGLLEVKLPQATQQIIAMLVLCIVSFFNMKAAFKKSIFYIIVVESLVYLKGLKEWQKYKTKNPATAYLDGEKTAKEQNYVLVIGESQSRDHLSAYGYARQTTPWLNEKKQDDDFILFKNAYSCHVMTAYVMAKVLTESNQYNQ